MKIFSRFFAIALAGAMIVQSVGCGIELDEDLDLVQQEIAGDSATEATAYGVESVVKIVYPSLCSGVLISDGAVLTAAHCFCSEDVGMDISTCGKRAVVHFSDVAPGGCTNPSDCPVQGNVVVHPLYAQDAWLAFDIAVVQLDTPASAISPDLTPYLVERSTPSAGDTVTMMGWGPSGDDCETEYGTLHKASTVVDHIHNFGPGARRVVTHDPEAFLCGGDSGGPLFSSNYTVVGVNSWVGDNWSHFASTDIVWDWLSVNACPDYDPAFSTWRSCENPMCPCGAGEGDCDNDDECEPGLVCVQNVGANYGLPSGFDMCECPAFDPSAPDWDFCKNPACPCGWREGDCDTSSECAGGLVCMHNVGASYGLPSSFDVCELGMYPSKVR